MFLFVVGVVCYYSCVLCVFSLCVCLRMRIIVDDSYVLLSLFGFVSAFMVLGVVCYIYVLLCVLCSSCVSGLLLCFLCSRCVRVLISILYYDVCLFLISRRRIIRCVVMCISRMCLFIRRVIVMCVFLIMIMIIIRIIIGIVIMSSLCSYY